MVSPFLQVFIFSFRFLKILPFDMENICKFSNALFHFYIEIFELCDVILKFCCHPFVMDFPTSIVCSIYDLRCQLIIAFVRLGCL